jgi:gamma-glutamylcyclotransferase (GGCT)/AIG2-like uncharacterized protein YtfP
VTPTHRVFVYGSLMAGLEHHDVLTSARSLGAATTGERFRLYAVDYYPAAVPGEGGEPLAGELYEVDDVVLAALDAVEDAPGYFERVRTALEGGTDAFIYVLPAERLPPDDSRPVPGGSWRAYRAAQKSQRQPR